MHRNFHAINKRLLRFLLLLALTAWGVGTWQVVGATAGPFSAAAGPGGWEISRWESTSPNSLSTFAYSTANETQTAPARARVWGVFVYHWLVVFLLAFFSAILAWTNRRDGRSPNATKRLPLSRPEIEHAG